MNICTKVLIGLAVVGVVTAVTCALIAGGHCDDEYDDYEECLNCNHNGCCGRCNTKNDKESVEELNTLDS